MDRTPLEGPHGHCTFVWHNGRISVELITLHLDKVNKKGDV